MSIIWKMVNAWSMNKKAKTNCFILISCLMSALAGFFLWFLLGIILWGKIKYLLCFVGYPMVFVGFFGGIYYLYNHEFTPDDV